MRSRTSKGQAGPVDRQVAPPSDAGRPDVDGIAASAGDAGPARARPGGVAGWLAGLRPRGTSPGTVEPRPPDVATAYQEALREALRSASALEPAITARPWRVAEGPPASPGTGTSQAGDPEPRKAPAATERAPMPANDSAAAARTIDPGEAAGVDLVVGPVPLPRGDGSAPDPATALDLPHVPAAVTTTADDFFGALVRRTERHP